MNDGNKFINPPTLHVHGIVFINKRVKEEGHLLHLSFQFKFIIFTD